MSAICQVTGRKPGFGKSVSHSHRRTNRRWNPNVQRRRFYLPSEGRTITLTVSTKGLKVIDRDGIEGRQDPRPWREGLIHMARNDIRPIIKLKSTAGTGYTYVTRKNKRNNPDRITLKKYDPVVRKHVEFREER